MTSPATTPSGRKLAMGAGAIGAVNLIKAGLQFLMLPVMAHLLSPAEFGLYALALPAVSLLSMLADGGLGASLSREPDSATIVWSTAFWMLLAAGVLFAAGLSGWGIALAALIHQPKLSPLMAVLSLSLVMLTLSVCPTARLTRQGQLAVCAGADLAGNIAGAAVGILLAVRHAGAFSLAAQYVVTYAVRALILNAAAFHPPGFTLHLSSLRGHIGNSSSLVGARIADFAGRMAENTVFGLTLGTASLGIYTFANQLPRFVGEAAGNPVWSALYVQALRKDDAALGALHAQLCRLLGIILFPAAALIAAAAPQLMVHLLGPKWAAAGPLLQIILPAYMLNTIASQSGAILLAKGRFDLQFYCAIGLSLSRVLAVCLAPFIGFIGVAVGIAIANGFYAASMLIIPASITSCRPGPILRGLAGPFTASLIGGTICWAFLNHYAYHWETLFAAFIIGGMAYLLSLVALDHAHLRVDFLAIQQLRKSR